MEPEEDNIFFELEKQFFGEPTFSNANQEVYDIVRKESIYEDGETEKVINNQGQKEAPYFRAFNPLERLKDMPKDKQNEYAFMFNNHKRFNGIQHFFEFGNQDKHSAEFLEGIQSDAFENSSNNQLTLERLFENEDQNKFTQGQQVQATIVELNKRLEEINQKNFGSINLNRTIASSFYQHFDNFSMVYNPAHFTQELELSIKNMINNCKKIKGPGLDLVVSIYDFWMKAFKDFMNEIWKHSSKFTLNFFKKEKNSEVSDTNSEVKSETSNNANTKNTNEKEKRKGWSIQDLNMLEEIINSDIIFSQSVLKKIANQLDRSTTSISSKIQKLIKNRKGEQFQEQSLLKRTIEILKLHPEGLNRQAIIQKMNENYEMGFGGQWEKSVGQLLSNRKQFLRVRGKHKLLEGESHNKENALNGDSVSTFKEKVIKCFLFCDNYESDLKNLVEIYISLFGQGETIDTINQYSRKSIQSNISKTLSRYDIFDSSNARTIYTLNNSGTKEQNAKNMMEIEVEDYFEL